jgi:hypothetical protein
LYQIFLYLFSYVEFKSEIFKIDTLGQVIRNGWIKVLPTLFGNKNLFTSIISYPETFFLALRAAGLFKEYFFCTSVTVIFSGIKTFSRLTSTSGTAFSFMIFLL